MKILYAALRADFGNDGDESKGLSYESTHIEPCFDKLAEEGIIELQKHYFDLDNTKAGMNVLIENAKRGCFDVIFSWPVTHALSIHLPYAKDIIKAGVPIVSYDCDAHMRFNNPGERFILSRHEEGYVSHWITPAKHTIPMYKQHGLKVYYMPFGCPDFCDKIPNIEKDISISFIGQSHSVRQAIIDELRANGLKVLTFGHFFKPHPDSHPRVTEQEMCEIFNRSKINLNFRHTSRNPCHGQIKGRCFEILGCGGFMVATQHIETNDFHEYYTPGIDFVEDHYIADTIKSIKYYLNHPLEREQMAANAYKKRQDNLWYTRLKNFIVSDINSFLNA